MNKFIRLFVVSFALGVVAESRAVNDVLWMGATYSVSVKYVEVVEEGVDTPFPKSLQMPDFPIEVMMAGASDDVTVLFLVTEDGTVHDIVVEKGGIDLCRDAVKAAVAKWTFRPSVVLKDRKKTVTAHMRCRFEFRTSEP